MVTVPKISAPDNNAITVPAWAADVFANLKRCTPAEADRRRAWLPYCVQWMPKLPTRAIVLNRWYKPLGLIPSYTPHSSRLDPRITIVECEVRYEDFPETHISAELHQALHEIGHLNADDCLFKDGSAPWLSAANLHVYRAKIIDFTSPWIDPSAWGRS
jgi:hypothetical protein